MECGMKSEHGEIGAPRKEKERERMKKESAKANGGGKRTNKVQREWERERKTARESTLN